MEETQNPDVSACPWQEAVAQTALEADSVRHFAVSRGDPATHVRFNIFPDGGVARLRVFAVPTRDGITAARLRLLNSWPADVLKAALTNCCGSGKWVEQVASQRRFSGPAHLFDVAERAAAGLSKEDWLEAFSHHPQIGQKRTGASQSARATQWSEQEQASAGDASSEVQRELAEANAAYQARFGYIFIVCATGKSADEMLSLMKDRMSNAPEAELRIAADEQRKITRLRLEKMLAS